MRSDQANRAKMVPKHEFFSRAQVYRYYSYKCIRLRANVNKKLPPKNITDLKMNGVEFNNLMKADQSLFI